MGPAAGGRRPAHPRIPIAAGEADILVHAMTDVLAHERPDSTAEALRVLRLVFPEYPLALRLVAVASAMKWANRATYHIPR